MTNLSRKEAVAALEAAGFTKIDEQAADSDEDKNKVLEQNPAAGTRWPRAPGSR